MHTPLPHRVIGSRALTRGSLAAVALLAAFAMARVPAAAKDRSPGRLAVQGLPRPAARPKGSANTLACGGMSSSSLDPSDPQLPDGTWYESYVLDLTEPSLVTITITAAQFEGYVGILDDRENLVADGRSPLETTLPAGTYTVIANNFGVLPSGNYPYQIAAACDATSADVLACGQMLSGTLEPADPAFDDGTWYDEYLFSLAEAADVTFDISAAGFDGYVLVYGLAGNKIQEGQTPLQISLAAGHYRVLANNFDVRPDGSYPYQLSAACSASTTMTIACGQSVDGALDPSDTELSDGTWVDFYELTLAQGTTVTVTLDAAFDGYVGVLDSDTNVVAEGRPPLEVELVAGDYAVLANNFAVLPDGHYPYALGLACAGSGTGCAGDCNGNLEVVINEIILGVNIALGSATADQCAAFDVNGDQQVMINELVLGVGSALNGCPA